MPLETWNAVPLTEDGRCVRCQIVLEPWGLKRVTVRLDRVPDINAALTTDLVQ